jgi:hypothetical protein
MKDKSFKTFRPGVNVEKLFSPVADAVKKARVGYSYKFLQ